MEMALNEVECRLVLSRALGRSDFVVERLVEKHANDSLSCGFMARHLSLVASVRVDGETRDVHLFAKVPPSSNAHRRLLEQMLHFEKEMSMYESVVPVMSQAMPEDVQLPLARCLLTRKADSAGREEVIVMEDLREMGYRLWDKMKPFDWAHCLSIVRSLARLHAASFLVQRTAVLKGKGNNKDYVDGTFRVAKDSMVSGTDREMGRLWADSSMDTFASAVAGLWPERFGDEGKRLRMRKRLAEAWDEISDMAKPSGKYTNVVCHGDLWPNNMMIKYEGGEPADVILVDLQIVRFAPPATDILMFFHTSTTKDFRAKHMRDLVLAYHGHLEEIVGKASLEELMPLRTLLGCIEEYALFGTMIGAVWDSIILSSSAVSETANGGTSGEPPDFVTTIMRDRGQEVLSNAREDEVFRTRMMESYEECLQHLGLWM